MNTNITTLKNYSLETIRGIAAFYVVFYHLMYAKFMPLSGGIKQFDIYNTHFLSFLNGSFAVYLFFILSGYVLTIKYLKTKDIKLLYTQALKRWPRLMPLIFISTILSWMIYIFNYTYIFESAKITNAVLFIDYPNPNLEPTFLNVIKQSFYSIFILGKFDYNVVMWSMELEFKGSFIVLFMAYLLRATQNKMYNLVLLSIFNLIILKYNATYFCFTIGLLLAYVQVEYKNFKISDSVALILGVSGLILGSKDINFGLFDTLYYSLTGLTIAIKDRYFYVLGGTFIVFATLFNAKLSMMLNTKWGKFLGHISFPLYLVHIPVMFSLGGYVYLHTQSQLMTSLTVILVSTLISIPLANFDAAWVKLLSKNSTSAINAVGSAFKSI